MKKTRVRVPTKRAQNYYSLLRYYRDVKQSNGKRTMNRFLKRAYNRHIRKYLRNELRKESWDDTA